MSRVQDLLLTAPGELRAAVSVPPLPALGPDDVLVEVDRVTLCGSDHRLFDGTYGGPRRYPIRFGHEWSGRVVDTGPNGDGSADLSRVSLASVAAVVRIGSIRVKPASKQIRR